MKTEVQQGIKEYRINIRRLQQGIKLKQEEVKKSLQQERVLLAEIEDIDMRLQAQLDKLSVLEKRMSNQQNLIELKLKELNRANQENDVVKNHLQNRIKAYYKMGRIGVINVAFSTQTLPDLLQFHDSFQSLIKYDKRVIDTYRHTITELEGVKKALNLEKELLENFILQAREEKDKTDLIKQEKGSLLSHIKSQTKLHQQAVQEMQEAANQLSSSLVVLESKEEYLEQGFLLNKGKLPTPVKGDVLVQFQEETTNKMGIRKKSNGITIKSKNGTRVKAIFSGNVIFAGYHRGYGNTVIIHHGFNYFTITSRLEKIYVKKQEKVAPGDLIGLTGVTTSLIEDGVYFEIRENKVIIDPMDWINPAEFIFD